METLTFSDLRKIQKEEQRADELTELDDDFLLKASSYLERKKENGEKRDYQSSQRVFDKIVALREKKIVRNARLSLKSDIKASELNLLPREKELFRETQQLFEEHRNRLKNVEAVKEHPEHEGEVEEKDQQIEKEAESEAEEGYRKVKILGNVPEFMGTDLEEYGPFEEGDKPLLPEDNAEILENRGNAEAVN